MPLPAAQAEHTHCTGLSVFGRNPVSKESGARPQACKRCPVLPQLPIIRQGSVFQNFTCQELAPGSGNTDERSGRRSQSQGTEGKAGNISGPGMLITMTSSKADNADHPSFQPEWPMPTLKELPEHPRIRSQETGRTFGAAAVKPLVTSQGLHSTTNTGWIMPIPW